MKYISIFKIIIYTFTAKQESKEVTDAIFIHLWNDQTCNLLHSKPTFYHWALETAKI